MINPPSYFPMALMIITPMIATVLGAPSLGSAGKDMGTSDLFLDLQTRSTLARNNTIPRWLVIVICVLFLAVVGTVIGWLTWGSRKFSQSKT
ncbi:hypothetical protein BJ875DRAFT_472694 [Amylocarpus encephaloides]|uniref:Uncharacterized protein n=1 Tax=Amylocarpus encephaloides TaxID=45428 RepID=A0A9P7YBK2_9HELO|nr:hypothetical protein BJ875DRAFT_472694 [Amylocarpus encephaloides]